MKRSLAGALAPKPWVTPAPKTPIEETLEAGALDEVRARLKHEVEALREAGVQDGDTVFISEFELEHSTWHLLLKWQLGLSSYSVC